MITTGVPLPASAVLSNGWVIPTLTGPKFDVFGANSGAPTAVGQDSTGDHAVWSPLGPDREQLLHLRGRRHPHHGVPLRAAAAGGSGRRLAPGLDLSKPTKVFRGDLYLDPATGALRRLRGQSLTKGGPPPQGRAKHLNRLVVNAAVADIVTTEVPGAGWVPTYQRIELEVLIPLTTQSWSVLRLMTRLSDVAAHRGPARGGCAAGSRPDSRSLRGPEGFAARVQGLAAAARQGRQLASTCPTSSTSGPPASA